MNELNLSNGKLDAVIQWKRNTHKKNYELVKKNKKDLNRFINKVSQDFSTDEIMNDQDIDMELIGKKIDKTETIYLDSKHNIQNSPPTTIHMITTPNGKSKKVDIIDTQANTNTQYPLRPIKTISIKDTTTKYVFSKTIQLIHTNGLTFDFLFSIAKQLHSTKTIQILGAGELGNQPIIFQTNGKKYRGFLEGRINKKQYKLLLHLSDLEIKKVTK